MCFAQLKVHSVFQGNKISDTSFHTVQTGFFQARKMKELKVSFKYSKVKKMRPGMRQ